MNSQGVEVKCPEDETNEQRILRAPAITLSDHRAMYDAKCGRPQRVTGVIKFGHLRTEGRGRKRVFTDVLYGLDTAGTATNSCRPELHGHFVL